MNMIKDKKINVLDKGFIKIALLQLVFVCTFFSVNARPVFYAPSANPIIIQTKPSESEIETIKLYKMKLEYCESKKPYFTQDLSLSVYANFMECESAQSTTEKWIEHVLFILLGFVGIVMCVVIFDILKDIFFSVKDYFN
jgi:hypothetical protein